MKLVMISKELQKKSYYQYFNNPELEEISDQEIKQLIGKPQEAEGLSFKKRSILQNQDFEDEPSGYYLLEDGGILFSCTTEVPNLTGDMMDWWFLWHQFDALRYALWNPEDHKGIRIIPENLKRFTNEKLPYNQRLWGTNSYPFESMNGEDGGEEIEIKFVNPETVGYDNSKIGSTACQSIVVAPGLQEQGGHQVPIFMTETLRQGPQGDNVWVARWWLGCGVAEDGSDVIIDLPNREKIAQKAAMLVVHSRKEMQHLNKVLPKLYSDYHEGALNHD
ncbi:hypothetical protein MK516_07245 [Streptococcus gallolyticus subsp. gallolyticus]|uniref:DAPG hydrolase family protein n=1 Tax=Streptococcus gallolyticus TaxID=315405 RepID=UPI002283AD35|nr:hypothetical protein [Streptococcus gallolyticus]MCY7172318.1 hypothetical protein [Streptococcus gallolyticus subsp. gallolyticus]